MVTLSCFPAIYGKPDVKRYLWNTVFYMDCSVSIIVVFFSILICHHYYFSV